MADKVDKCVYCNCEIHDGRSLSVCDKCGIGVWGKMFHAIKKNMDNARERGDLEQGSVK
jgi:uncharacterized UBP type Zn finger protein